MKLIVLGKYGPFPKQHSATSSYLLETDGKFFLLDAGSGSFSRLCAILPPEKLNGIIISHSHYDHTADLGVYHYYFENLSKRGVPFIKPRVYLFDDGSPSLRPAVESPYFDVVNISDGAVFTHEGTELAFTRLYHPATDFGVKFRSENKVFCYTGDTNLCDPLENFVTSADVFLADGGFLSRDWSEKKPHLSVEIICKLS